MKTKVLMIDDDAVPGVENAVASYMWYYADELRRRDYHVIETIGADDAMLHLARDKHIDLVVLDVMMPPAETFRGNEAADRGQRTGACLVEEILSKSTRIPIVVLTNVASEEVLGALRSNSSVKRILFKFDVTPSAFADEVADVLNGEW